MSILTELYGIPQLRCLPTTGGKNASPLRYVTNLPGRRDEVNHSFVAWAAGELNRIRGGGSQ
jgi:hypothetical protein